MCSEQTQTSLRPKSRHELTFDCLVNQIQTRTAHWVQIDEQLYSLVNLLYQTPLDKSIKTKPKIKLDNNTGTIEFIFYQFAFYLVSITLEDGFLAPSHLSHLHIHLDWLRLPCLGSTFGTGEASVCNAVAFDAVIAENMSAAHCVRHSGPLSAQSALLPQLLPFCGSLTSRSVSTENKGRHSCLQFSCVDQW